MKGKKVKEIRKNLGLTQVQFAQKLGVSIRTVGRWEKDETQISEQVHQQIERIAEKKKYLIYSQKSQKFLIGQKIHRGYISPWVLLAHSLMPPINAEEIFVNLRISNNSENESSLKLADLPQKAEEQPIVVIGKAGSGKSFLIRWIIGVQGTVAEKDEYHELSNKIPILFPLIEYAEILLKEKESKNFASLLEKFGNPLLAAIADYHHRSNTGLDDQLLITAYKKGEVMFLFDGLDEISDVNCRDEALRDIEKLILQNPNCSVLLTSRPDIVPRPSNLFISPSFNPLICKLEPLNDTEQKKLVKKLYVTVSQGPKFERVDYKITQCINFVKNIDQHDPKEGAFLTNPLYLVLAALLILEGFVPGVTDVQLEHQILELNIIRWPGARSLGLSLMSSGRFPGTGIPNNYIWSELGKWALDIIEKGSSLNIEEIEKWVLSIPNNVDSPKGDTKEMRVKRIANSMIELLPFINLVGNGKFTIDEPYKSYLAAYHLTGSRDTSPDEWLFKGKGANKYYRNPYKVNVWKKILLITSIIHHQPHKTSDNLNNFIGKFNPNEHLDYLFNNGVIFLDIIARIIKIPGVIDWSGRREFYRSLIEEIYLNTEFDETAKFWFNMFRLLRISTGIYAEESGEVEEVKRDQTILGDICHELMKKSETYDHKWRLYTLQYALETLSGKETEEKLLNLIKELEKKITIEKSHDEREKLEIILRRVIFGLLLMRLSFPMEINSLREKFPQYELNNETILTLINIYKNRARYETGIVGRAYDILGEVEKQKNLDNEIKQQIKSIRKQEDPLISKIVRQFKQNKYPPKPDDFIQQVCQEMSNSGPIYNVNTVKKLKDFLNKASDFYENKYEETLNFSETLLECAIDYQRPPLFRATAFLYLSELKEENKKPKNFLARLEKSLKDKDKHEENRQSVGAIQIYDYNQACLNRQYARQQGLSEDIVTSPYCLKDFEKISYIG